MCGYAENQKIITSSIVKKSAKNLRLPEHRREEKQERKVIAQPPDLDACFTSKSP
jgi:hypothetical protein